MRALVLVFLVGCIERTAAPPFDELPPLGSAPSAGACHDGRGCPAGEVCARNDACLPPEQVRAVHVMWTVSGMAASQATCAAAPDLRIQLNSSDSFVGGVGWAPVPCEAGKFSVDRLPIAFNHVWLGRENGDGRRESTIDPATAEATLDLPYGAKP
jgi:hypothetical protein